MHEAVFDQYVFPIIVYSSLAMLYYSWMQKHIFLCLLLDSIKSSQLVSSLAFPDFSMS